MNSEYDPPLIGRQLGFLEKGPLERDGAYPRWKFACLHVFPDGFYCLLSEDNAIIGIGGSDRLLSESPTFPLFTLLLSS